jgi:hypothetical protein
MGEPPLRLVRIHELLAGEGVVGTRRCGALLTASWTSTSAHLRYCSRIHRWGRKYGWTSV